MEGVGPPLWNLGGNFTDAAPSFSIQPGQPPLYTWEVVDDGEEEDTWTPAMGLQKRSLSGSEAELQHSVGASPSKMARQFHAGSGSSAMPAASSCEEMARGDGSFAWVQEELSSWAASSPADSSSPPASPFVQSPAPVEPKRIESKPVDERVAAEVQRIRSIGIGDYRRILELQPSESHDLQAVQTKYRQLMRLLHPDKRSAQGELRAGGRDVCDDAVRIVQHALKTAKDDLEGYEPDAERRRQESMRRIQEMQRQNARHAAQRHQQTQVGQLSTEIDRALAAAVGGNLSSSSIGNNMMGGMQAGYAGAAYAGAGHAGASSPDAKAQEIMNLLRAAQGGVAPSGPAVYRGGFGM